MNLKTKLAERFIQFGVQNVTATEHHRSKLILPTLPIATYNVVHNGSEYFIGDPKPLKSYFTCVIPDPIFNSLLTNAGIDIYLRYDNDRGDRLYFSVNKIDMNVESYSGSVTFTYTRDTQYEVRFMSLSGFKRAVESFSTIEEYDDDGNYMGSVDRKLPYLKMVYELLTAYEPYDLAKRTDLYWWNYYSYVPVDCCDGKAIEHVLNELKKLGAI